MFAIVCVLVLLQWVNGLDTPCEFGYSPCDPPTVDGECVFSPGEQCNIDSVGLVFCCIVGPTNISSSSQIISTTTSQPETSLGTSSVQPTVPDQTTEASTTTDSQEECEDLIPYCFTNYCDKFESTMRLVCSKSCGFCGATESSTPVTTTKVSPTVPCKKCSDRVKNCKRSKGYCKHPQYRAYMEENCSKTCGFCKKDKSHEHSSSSEDSDSSKKDSSSSEEKRRRHSHSAEKHNH